MSEADVFYLLYLMTQKVVANVYLDLHFLQSNQNIYSKPFMFKTQKNYPFHADTF